MNLVAITVPYFYDGEGRDIVSVLECGRFGRVHIRKPGASVDEMRTLLDAVPAEYRSNLTLHDCLELAEEYGVGGVHLSRRNAVAPAGWKGIVSRSLHAVEDISAATEDYVFLSPVYPSISKPGYRGTFDLEELKGYVNSKVYALGGVTPERLTELESAGFGGAAMLGSVWCRQIDMSQFGLQFITHGETSDEVVEGAMAALEGGCRWVQVRMKDRDVAEVEKVVLRLAPACRDRNAVLLVDDHVELAARLDCVDGVHVGKNDMPVAEARKVLGPSKILGATANTAEDVMRAATDGADYVGLGPFRFTTTKKNLSPVLGLEGYAGILRRCRDAGYLIPIVAIGGITESDIKEIMSTGVGGIAVSGTILRAGDRAAKTAELMNVINGTAGN